ncbi:MAG: FecR family protein [Bacteroidota bacterium]
MEELLAKYFSEDATNDERSLVESWRSASKENADTYLSAKIGWIESGHVELNRQDILRAILEEKDDKNITYWLNNSWVRYAAAVVLVLGVCMLFVLNNQDNDKNYVSQLLADQSEIALYENAMVELITFDENVREVKLIGKAYFDIKKDENRPFIIHTENATVKVLGTSFLIDANDADTEVCVESGLVELIKDDKSVSVKLEKGKVGLVSAKNEGIIKKENENLNYLAWKTKVLTFKDHQMSEVKEVLEEVYGIVVKFENASFSDCKLTAKFNKKKPKDAIEIIARTFNIDYEFKNNIAILKGKGC